jgi:heptosyltransferase-1
LNNRFLIVRLGALGDVVHAVPVAAALRRAQPAARIDWLVSAKHGEFLTFVTGIDRRFEIRDRHGAGGGQSLLSALRELRTVRYDVVLDLQGLIKSALMARLTGARRIVGFSSAYLREPLARMAYTETWDPGGPGMFDPQERRHVVDVNLGLLQTIGLRAGAAEFPVAPPKSHAADHVAQQTHGRYALINAGAAWPNKRWPPDRFADLARRMSSRHGLRSVVLWGPGEHDLADSIVSQAGDAAILSPPTTIGDLLAIASRAVLMISGDTGPTHLAAAVGTPIVGVYGPTRPERNGPWGVRNVSVSRADVCECHHLRQCRRATMCLMDITVDEVAAAVATRLTTGARVD